MKNRVLAVLLAGFLLLSGCGEQTPGTSADASSSAEPVPSSSVKESTTAADVTESAFEQAVKKLGGNMNDRLPADQLAGIQSAFDKERMYYYFLNPRYEDAKNMDLSLVFYDGIIEGEWNYVSDTHRGQDLSEAERKAVFEAVGSGSEMELKKITADQLRETLKKYTGLEWAEPELGQFRYLSAYDAYYLAANDAVGAGAVFSEGVRLPGEPEKVVIHWNAANEGSAAYREGYAVLQKDGERWLFLTNIYLEGKPAW